MKSLRSLQPRARRHALALAAALAVAPSFAFSQTATPSAAVAAASTTLEPVVITGNPLGSDQIAAPVSVLGGDELVLRRGSSLGETLATQPGVSSTYFGPNANRPTIRGLDGDRVRILSNAGASVDASSLSFDHAVPIDPLIVERIEVLRGPGALLYGGSAVGGVVNTIDNRIPDERIDRFAGALELRAGGADGERGGAVLAETGNGRFALHVDAFGRSAFDLDVPRHTPVADGEALPEAGAIRNSAGRADGGALGGTLFFDGGHVGVEVDAYDSDYGVVAEPDVTIGMKREHAAVALTLDRLGGPLQTLDVKLDRTDYRHREIEGSGEIGTTFDSRGSELRVEARHAPLGPLRGVWGLQWEDVDFSALGEEAFVPSTRTTKHALFALEELAWAGGTLAAGLRVERARVGSAGDPADAQAPQFGPADERRFSLRSGSVSNLTKLSPPWTLTAAWSATERAPTSFELYANGVHVATAAFERGDPSLGKERGDNLDVALQWQSGASHLRVGAFAARFSRFISLEATGNTIELEGEDGEIESFPEFAFVPVRARLSGIEIEGRHRLLDAPWTLDASGKLDFTRGKNADSGEALPRIAPLRVLLRLDLGRGPWGGRIELDHAGRQSRVPATDEPTAGYTLVNLALTRRFGSDDGVNALAFVKLGNLTDRLAYSASTTQTVRGLSPLAGRSLEAGVRVVF